MLASQCYQQFLSATKTISLPAIAKRLGAIRRDRWPAVRVFTFPDQSEMHCTGAGRNLRVTISLEKGKPS